VAAFIYEYERYRENNVAILGISPQSVDHGKQLRDRTLRDTHLDQAAHKAHEAFWQDPSSAFPVRLIPDPDCSLS